MQQTTAQALAYGKNRLISWVMNSTADMEPQVSTVVNLDGPSKFIVTLGKKPHQHPKAIQSSQKTASKDAHPINMWI